MRLPRVAPTAAAREIGLVRRAEDQAAIARAVAPLVPIRPCLHSHLWGAAVGDEVRTPDLARPRWPATQLAPRNLKFPAPRPVLDVRRVAEVRVPARPRMRAPLQVTFPRDARRIAADVELLAVAVTAYKENLKRVILEARVAPARDGDFGPRAFRHSHPKHHVQRSSRIAQSHPRLQRCGRALIIAGNSDEIVQTGDWPVFAFVDLTVQYWCARRLWH